jgi:hypothetical protein
LVEERLLEGVQGGELSAVDGFEALGLGGKGVEFGDDGSLADRGAAK